MGEELQMEAGRFTREVEDHIEAVRAFFESQAGALEDAAQALAQCLENGGKILFFGNGGSAADAQHLAAELVNRMSAERPGMAAIALTTDSSALTSIANDTVYERVFARQVEALGRKGDMAYALSTSGDSPSILEGLKEARKWGLGTIGVLGRDGGAARTLVDYPLVVAGRSTARIQEVHALVGHLICERAEAILYPEAVRESR